jgi:preprotein translocase subunit YajC
VGEYGFISSQSPIQLSRCRVDKPASTPDVERLAAILPCGFSRRAAVNTLAKRDFPLRVSGSNLTQNMSIYSLNPIVAMAPTQSADGKTASPLATFVPLILMMVIFWFLLIRPQQRKQKQHQQMLTKLKSGDRVVTSSGIIGTVISVKDKAVTVRTAGDTKLEFTKSAIAEIVESANAGES